MNYDIRGRLYKVADLAPLPSGFLFGNGLANFFTGNGLGLPEAIAGVVLFRTSFYYTQRCRKEMIRYRKEMIKVIEESEEFQRIMGPIDDEITKMLE